MPHYLIETYTPVSKEPEIRAGFARVAARGGSVHHLHATFVPEDETCFNLVEAPSLEAVREALTGAAVPFERIVEATG